MTTNQKNQLEFLNGVFNASCEVNKVKTFFNIMRDVTNVEWFSASEIASRYSTNYRKHCTSVLFNSFDKANITSIVTDEIKINNLVNKITNFAVHFMSNETDSNIRADFNAQMTEFVSSGNDIFNNFTNIINKKQLPEPKQQEEKTEVKIVDNSLTDERISKAVESFLNVNGITLNVNSQIKTIQADLKNNADRVEKEFVSKTTAIESKLDADIKKQVSDAVNSLRPVIVTIGNRPTIKLEKRMHAAFEKCLRLLNRERQVFIAGPAGTGKTTLASQCATAFNLPFGQISCTLGMSEAHLLGRMDAHGNYISSSFVEIYEKGGIFLFDEVDAADANTMLIINSALANGLLSVPNRKGNNYAKRHADFYCLCAANTWGFGSSEYAGRNILDAAFLDRFSGSRMLVTYDVDLEKHIAGNFRIAAETVWTIRKNCVENQIRRVVSTRAVESATRALADGESISEFVDTFTCGWTDEEKKKALNGVRF